MSIEYASLDHYDFRELVAKEAKGQVEPEAAAFLRSEAGLRCWANALRELTRELETQFAKRKADAESFQNACLAEGSDADKREWYEYKAEYDRWRAAGGRFKRGIEMRLAESKTLMRERKLEADREVYRALLHELGEFLSKDGAISRGFVAERDRLREKISRTLFGEA